MKRNRIFYFIVSIASALLLWQCPAGAQMTQSAAIEYVKSQMQTGKSTKDIASQLTSMGLSTDDLKQLQEKYGENFEEMEEDDRFHTLNKKYVEKDDTLGVETSKLKVPTPEDESNIHGHNSSAAKRLTFEPDQTAAPPDNYKLGPGDQLIIDIWGASETTIKQVISPDGALLIPHVGQIQLGGLTIKEATRKIRKAVSTRYSGIEGANPASDISVTLGKVRTIQVNVLGEVKAPGTFRLSSLSTLFNAIYRAGGVTETGSLRAVRLTREGETIAVVDLYDFLFTGNSSGDMPLKDGDAIIVPVYQSLVTVDGAAKRPMRYELIEGESAARLLDYAGGFAADAYKGEVTVHRTNGREREIFSIRDKNLESFHMADGDSLVIGTAIDRNANMVSIEGCVYRPGSYELGGDIATLRQLIEHAEGLREDAFLDRAIITRQREDLSLQTVAVDLKGILAGTSEDVILRRNDLVNVSAITDLKDYGIMTIVGSVRNAGDYPFAENTTVEDLIYLAGGILDGASTVKVDISRRVNDPESLQTSNVQAESFTVEIRNGLLVNPKPFILKPYDIVSIRNNPVYNNQKMVTVTGEVAFDGDYVLLNANDRISSVIERAGGVSPRAYLAGGKLMRRLSDDERSKSLRSSRMMQRSGITDTLSLALVDTLATGDSLEVTYYTVGVNLDKALKNPGSDYDVVLRDGDKIIIPEFDGTVRIQGEVMYPNAVSYIKGNNLHYYITQAGGYSQKAKRRGVYIVNPNGTVAKANALTSIEPGSEIFVPSKPEKKGASLTEVMSLTTSTVSLATMIIAIIRYLPSKS
ncbi:MAG: SLBB domain-containing protein [Bacteroidales bacterium]|nr:SLBB domain-containing protein [Bacteroidales bacterium]